MGDDLVDSLTSSAVRALSAAAAFVSEGMVARIVRDRGVESYVHAEEFAQVDHGLVRPSDLTPGQTAEEWFRDDLSLRRQGSARVLGLDSKMVAPSPTKLPWVYSMGVSLTPYQLQNTSRIVATSASHPTKVLSIPTNYLRALETRKSIEPSKIASQSRKSTRTMSRAYNYPSWVEPRQIESFPPAWCPFEMSFDGLCADFQALAQDLDRHSEPKSR